MQDIARIISEDQGLTARLLKIANSPLYGFNGVASIQRAVTLIGTREIRDLALAVSLVKTNFCAVQPDAERRLRHHWRHSISCAVVARNIAFFLREADIDRFFVAGILHNIGRMLLWMSLPELAERAVTRAMSDKDPLHIIEQELLGFDHAKLGGALLESWNLPPGLARTASFHHQPAHPLSNTGDAAIIHLADLICQAFGWGPDLDIPMICLDEKSWELIDFPLNALVTVVTQSELQLHDILSILQDQ
jgi:HD-like signal output (HDOD) protein